MILVTGGVGRLGFEVVKLLLHEGKKVRVLDLPYIDWSNIESLKGIDILKGDITDPTLISQACKDAETIIHLAALIPPKSEVNREITLKVNVQGTQHILEASGREIPIVFASSISTYGVTAGEVPPINEGHPITAHDNYSESKILGEAIVTKSGNPYATLRIAPITVIDLVELPSVVPYRGDQRVEFVCIEDAAQAVWAALKITDEKETFNVAGGASWQMRGSEYIGRYYAALGVEVDPKFSDVYTALDYYDTSKSRRLGYQRTTFSQLEERLKALGEELGLR